MLFQVDKFPVYGLHKVSPVSSVDCSYSYLTLPFQEERLHQGWPTRLALGAAF